ncbi:MAG: acyl-CoA/acyl-ACP dehydrogenase [bacterium]|nr:acyl-CoA/acyl-ACP dehydrogenase [bacterium]
MPLELAEFNLSEERLEFRDTLRRFFEEHAPITEVRRVMDEEGTGHSAALWQSAADELGLAGIAIPEKLGGQGFGLKELGIALGEVGRSLAPIPLFASAGLAGRDVLHDAGQGADDWLTPIAEGKAATLAWVEERGDWDPAATRLELVGDGDEVRLTGEKHFVLDAGAAATLFVIARTPGSTRDEGLTLVAIDASATGLTLERPESLDLTRPVWTLRFSDTPGRVVGPVGGAAPGLRQGLDEATALLCSEMEGGMRKVIETAVDYAAERFQFSRPIGSFQVIKHKCADLLIDYEGARTASDGAIVAHDEGDPEASLLTSVAKSYMGPAYVRMATESGQIQGGVGYTWEYDAHLYFRRALASKALLGDEAVHRDRLTRHVARTLEAGAA